MRNRVVIAAIAGIVAVAAFVGAAPAVRLPRIASIANVTSAAAKLLDVRAPKAPAAAPAAAAVGAGAGLEAATTDTLAGILGSGAVYVAESKVVITNNGKISGGDLHFTLQGYVTSAPYYDACAYDEDAGQGRTLRFYKQVVSGSKKTKTVTWVPIAEYGTGYTTTDTIDAPVFGQFEFEVEIPTTGSSLVIIAEVDSYEDGYHNGGLVSCGSANTKFTFKIDRPRRNR